MSEIRDRVKHEMVLTVQKLMEATEAYERGDISWEEAALYTQAYPEEILSIPELAKGLEAVEKGYNAKVDRKAGLPNIFTNGEEPKSILRYREELANYVLEIKE